MIGWMMSWICSVLFYKKASIVKKKLRHNLLSYSIFGCELSWNFVLANQYDMTWLFRALSLLWRVRVNKEGGQCLQREWINHLIRIIDVVAGTLTSNVLHLFSSFCLNNWFIFEKFMIGKYSHLNNFNVILQK